MSTRDKDGWVTSRDGQKKLVGYQNGGFFILKLRHSFALFQAGRFVNEFGLLADAKTVVEYIGGNEAAKEHQSFASSTEALPGHW